MQQIKQAKKFSIEECINKLNEWLIPVWYDDKEVHPRIVSFQIMERGMYFLVIAVVETDY